MSDKKALEISTPVPGLYKMRQVKGGPFVPVHFELVDGDRDPETGELMSDQVYTLTVNGKTTTDWQTILTRWPWFAGQPIDEAEYRFMVADRDWLETHGRGQAGADPYKPIDLNRTATIF